MYFYKLFRFKLWELIRQPKKGISFIFPKDLHFWYIFSIKIRLNKIFRLSISVYSLFSLPLDAIKNSKIFMKQNNLIVEIWNWDSWNSLLITFIKKMLCWKYALLSDFEMNFACHICYWYQFSIASFNQTRARNVYFLNLFINNFYLFGKQRVSVFMEENLQDYIIAIFSENVFENGTKEIRI